MIFMDHRRRRMYLLLIALLTLAMVASMELGSQPMGPGTLAKTLVGYGDEVRQMILLSFRLPRVVLALLVGMGVSVSGVLMQGVLRNDLAAPGVLGVSAGGNLGVVVALLIGGLQLASPWIVPGMSILGGLAALLLVCLLAADGDVTSPTKLLLMGVAVSAACGALTLILSLILSLNLDRQVYAYAVAWMSGSLGEGGLELCFGVGCLVGRFGALVAWCTAPMMNVLRLGDGHGHGPGAFRATVADVALGVGGRAQCRFDGGGRKYCFLGTSCTAYCSAPGRAEPHHVDSDRGPGGDVTAVAGRHYRSHDPCARGNSGRCAGGDSWRRVFPLSTDDH